MGIGRLSLTGEVALTALVFGVIGAIIGFLIGCLVHLIR
jgi:hypothetical protein